MKDYFGHEINYGDVILYSLRGTHGYHAAYTESVVTEFASDSKVKVIGKYGSPNGDARLSKNVINLTALGIRPHGETVVGNPLGNICGLMVEQTRGYGAYEEMSEGT